MNTYKMEELIGVHLDMAVALAEGWTRDAEDPTCWTSPDGHAASITEGGIAEGYGYHPSTDWAHAGPIIQRENIMISPPTSRVHRHGGDHAGWGPSGYWSACTWHAGLNGRRSFGIHQTSAIVAALRCYVMHKLGDTVEF